MKARENEFTLMVQLKIIQRLIDCLECLMQSLRIMSENIESIEQIEEFLEKKNIDLDRLRPSSEKTKFFFFS